MVSTNNPSAAARQGGRKRRAREYAAEHNIAYVAALRILDQQHQADQALLASVFPTPPTAPRNSYVVPVTMRVAARQDRDGDLSVVVSESVEENWLNQKPGNRWVISRDVIDAVPGLADSLYWAIMGDAEYRYEEAGGEPGSAATAGPADGWMMPNPANLSPTEVIDRWLHSTDYPYDASLGEVDFGFGSFDATDPDPDHVAQAPFRTNVRMGFGAQIHWGGSMIGDDATVGGQSMVDRVDLDNLTPADVDRFHQALLTARPGWAGFLDAIGPYQVTPA